MKEEIFESKLLPDGHLYCPKKFAKKKNARFKVTVIFEDSGNQATEADIELASAQDLPEDSLSKEELKYYLNLEDYE